MWHCLLLDHVLELRRISVLRETDCLSLDAAAMPIAHVTDILARQHAPDRADLPVLRMAWRARLSEALELPACAQVPETLGLAGIPRAVGQLSRLSWMLRPRVMKAWCKVVLDGDTPAPPSVADALRALCLLMDTPMPPALQAFYPPSTRSGDSL